MSHRGRKEPERLKVVIAPQGRPVKWDIRCRRCGRSELEQGHRLSRWGFCDACQYEFNRMIEKLAEWWAKQNGRLLLLGLLILGISGLGVSAEAEGIGASLGLVFVGNGFSEYAPGISFVGRLDLGVLVLFEFMTFGEGSRAFGLHAGWDLGQGWLWALGS